QQKAAGMATWKDRLARFERYVFKQFGPLAVDKVKASHVRTVLDAVRDLGKSRQTLIHVKNDISVVLGELWRAEVLPENICERVQVPEALPTAVEQSKKERAVLTDDELVQYLAWEHPDERYRMATLERQTMACISRMFGGLRTSDLHAIRWDGFDLDQGGFSWGYAPRRKGHRLSKGGKPQKLWVPEMLRPILRDWWERHGKPSQGLVFPKRRGKDAGHAARDKVTHARAFRRDLRRAFGIHQPELDDSKRANGRKLNLTVWKPVRELTARERVLFEETEYSRPVDFHSWRRAFNQALADAGVNLQQAQALAGHSSLAAHERYLRNSEKERAIPTAALPQMGIKVHTLPDAECGHTAMGTLHESTQLLANTSPGNESETPLKLAVGSDLANLQAGSRRFETCPAY
ncbi:MAG TPA: site-specific integrase, partial [Polyangiaceae bacterium]